MSTPFEFRLQDMPAADGSIEADDLLAIVTGLKHIALALARETAEAHPRGRPNHQVDRLAALQISLAPGSTRIQFVRAPQANALPLDFDDEATVDSRFEELIDALSRNDRPAWVTSPVATGVAELARALGKASPRVEFSARGVVRAMIQTASVRADLWKDKSKRHLDDVVSYIGRLEKVDLHSGEFRIRDDAGFGYALPSVVDPMSAAKLVGTHVLAEGEAERSRDGAVAKIHGATLTPAPDPLEEFTPQPTQTLEELLASAPGPSGDGIPDLTDDEVEAFLAAIKR